MTPAREIDPRLQKRWQEIALHVGQALYGKPAEKSLGHALDLCEDWVREMLTGKNPDLRIDQTDLSELANLCRERATSLTHWAKVLDAEVKGTHATAQVPVAREMITEVIFYNDDGSVYSIGEVDFPSAIPALPPEHV